MQFDFDLATPTDDLALRRLLAETPMPGRITVAFEREPDYFHGCATMGPFWQAIIARDPENGELAGVVCRAVAPHYINGKPRNLGYIGQIRVAEKYRGLWLLHQGMAYFRELDRDGRAPAYWGVISDENRIPRGVLVERRRRSFPAAREIAHIYTLGIILRRPQKPLPFNGTIERGMVDTLPEIVEFLQRTGAKKQFFPLYTVSDFTDGERLRGFDVQDFLVSRQGGAIVGVLGLWDQRAYKQSVVRAYDRGLMLLKPVYNLGARLLGAQPLPNTGESIHSIYASFICVNGNDPDTFAALLRVAYNVAAERQYAYLMLGLTIDDPLLRAGRSYPHIDYHSHLYLGSWSDKHDGLGEPLDDRPVYIEIAAL